MEGFSVRVIETETEFESIVIKATVEENWRPGLNDAKCFFSCDPSGTIVGEVNGKPIGSVTITKYGDDYGFVGMYIVNKEYRGKGYGLAMYMAALDRVKPRTTGGCALLERENMYKRIGYQSLLYGARYDFHLPTALSCFSGISEESLVNIRCIDEVDEEALFTYDSHVFGYPRYAFLTKWLRVPGCHVHVATDADGSVEGYVVARPTYVKEDGFRIGPLFADSESIAEKLLMVLFKGLLLQEGSTLVICMDSFSEKAQILAAKLQGIKVSEMVYMTTSGVLPKGCFDKWFGHTTLGIG
ncbi:holothin acyltransferase-like [Montipora capricornis]|uniref:holothin acyltransferase-like n=1 Tax=Montipora capricornis TaxID=246305 RepID=UPI0035F21342